MFSAALQSDAMTDARAHVHFQPKALVREFIANPCMDFQKSTDINMDIYDFWMSVFNYPYKRGYPH